MRRASLLGRCSRMMSHGVLPIILLAPALGVAQPPADSSAPTTPAPLLSAPTRPIEFDIATFKLNKSNGPMPHIVIPLGGDGFIAINRPVHDLIRFAFAKGIGSSYRMSGQPAWVDNDRYDVQAKVAPEDLAEWKKLDGAGQKIPIQGFLVQCFKLKYHQDQAEYPYYALVVGKNGPKIQPAKPGELYKGPDGKPVGPKTLLWTGQGDLNAYSVEMDHLADQLSRSADRPIVNETGLTGFFNFTLHFNGGPNPFNPDGPDVPFPVLRPDAATPNIFSAVKQLGLELKPAKGPLDGIVIDHIERPPEN